ncbi:MAG: hypothetical protein LBS73_06420 [Campylobacteraceae bacterium]|jgi:hypothetical protein|nr:hypothetical protein [Campylobacteraceae bacterium]
MKNIYKTFALSSVLILLSGCVETIEDNNKSNNDAESASVSAAAAAPVVLLVDDCDGISCGANGNSYKGSGVGVWRYTNKGSGTASLDISLSNVGGKDVTVVFTNERSSSISLPSNGIPLNKIIPDKFLEQKVAETIELGASTFNDIPDHIRHFDKQEMLRQAAENSSQNFAVKPSSQKEWILGNQTIWYVQPGEITEIHTATLRKQTKSGYRTINFWVENGEFTDGKISQTTLDYISEKFTNSVYNNVVSIAGEPWGATGSAYGNSLIDENQPLDIVFVNFDRNSKGGGVVGYFWALNNMRTSSYYKYSNEALVFFADTETLYLTPNGINIMLSVAAHELTHMVNFYQRDVRMSVSDVYDIFLEELTAVMMEDVIGSQIAEGFNDVRDNNYRTWLSGALYNCDFTDWNNCNGQNINSYHVAGSFGAYLLRHYGIGFYKNLLKYPVPRPLGINDRQNSIALLDNVIKTANGEGLGRAVQRWGAGISLLPSDSLPTNLGYPERYEGQFYLSAFDSISFQDTQRLAQKPSVLNGYGHYVTKGGTTADQYRETVAVPSGVSVAVVVK